MYGYTVRAPPKLDIESAEGSIRVWVDQHGIDGEEEGEVSFPTIVLSADELRLASQIHGLASSKHRSSWMGFIACMPSRNV